MLGADADVSKQTALLVPVLIKHCTVTKCLQVSAITQRDELTFHLAEQLYVAFVVLQVDA